MPARLRGPLRAPHQPACGAEEATTAPPRPSTQLCARRHAEKAGCCPGPGPEALGGDQSLLEMPTHVAKNSGELGGQQFKRRQEDP